MVGHARMTTMRETTKNPRVAGTIKVGAGTKGTGRKGGKGGKRGTRRVGRTAMVTMKVVWTAKARVKRVEKRQEKERGRQKCNIVTAMRAAKTS